MNTKTAILIFANSAEKDAQLKSFSSKALFNALTTETIKTVEKTGLTYFHFSEKEQTGFSFGARFTNAIQNIFNKGFEHVITIGNDTPHLKAKHLLKTANQLTKNNIVLGPSKDGGFYLMGIKKSHFNAKTFQKLPWQTTALKSTVLKWLTIQKIEVKLLETLSDIDSVADIKEILNSFKSIAVSIKNILVLLINLIKNQINSSSKLFYSTILSSYYNKGSPIKLHI